MKLFVNTSANTHTQSANKSERGQSPIQARSVPEIMVGAGRFELPTSWSQTKRPTTGLRPVRFIIS